jgi:hypothetical protein
MFGRRIPDNVRHTFRRDALAEALWQYGEDELAEAALDLTEDDLQQVQLLDVWHHQNDPDPATGPKLTNGRIMSRAMIEWAEGSARDTKRTRRRTRPKEEAYRSSLPSTPAEMGLDRHD